MSRRLVVATGNPGKVVEIKALLEGVAVELVTQKELGVEDAIEDGLSFVENSLIKARHASRITGLPALADDSGIVVDALDGAPGIRSARYAGEEANDADNNAKLLATLKALPDAPRTARFFCAAVYVAFGDDPCPLIAQASWEGEIIDTPRGDNGFGYDPLFVVEGDTRTSAELSAAEKNRLSHRAQAVKALITELKPRLS